MKISIKILGADCEKCNTLLKRVQSVVDKNSLDAEVEKITDVQVMAGYSVFVVPVLIINEKVVSKGSLLSENQIATELNAFLPQDKQIPMTENKRSTGRMVLFITVLIAVAVATVLLLNNSSSSEATRQKGPLSMKDSIQKMYNYSENGQSLQLTFLEFGSTNCIPCRKMETVMAQIRDRYKDRVNTVFYNVTEAQNDSMANYFEVDVIPLQVLLNRNGEEFFRHVGFFPADSLSAIIDEQIKLAK